MAIIKIMKEEGRKLIRIENSFTLVELMVAMTIFIVFISIASAIFVNSLKTQKKINNLVEIADNSGLVIEQLVREIRTGYNFYEKLKNKEVVNVENTTTLEFYNYQGKKVKYGFQENNGQGKIIKEVDGIFYDLTPKDVDIDYLYFTVKQYNHYCHPWRVTINFNVGSKKTDIKQKIDLQASVSSRILPIESPGFVLDCR